MLACHQGAWLIRPGKVLHKRLQDFTVGHTYLLQAMESPFIQGGSADLLDLVSAVLVCSMPFDKACTFLMQPIDNIARAAARWGFWCRLRGYTLDEEMQKFRAYIGAYTEMPDVYEDKNNFKRRESALPFGIRLAWLLMERMSEREAWNCPLSRALTYWQVDAESKGTDFESEEHIKVLEA